jgi:hypothetical protein
MTKKFFITIATMIAVAITTTTNAQQCGGPVPVLSIYTTLDRNASFSIGSEFGSMNEESPWSYFGGILFTIKNEPSWNLEKQQAKAQEIKYQSDLTIYMKGGFRLFRSDIISIHAVVGAEMDSRSRFDVKPGVRFLFPVGDRVALSAEPLYSPRNRNVTGRVGFTIAF